MRVYNDEDIAVGTVLVAFFRVKATDGKAVDLELLDKSGGTGGFFDNDTMMILDDGDMDLLWEMAT